MDVSKTQDIKMLMGMLKVLIVEDELPLAEMLRYNLEAEALGSSVQVYVALLNRRQAEAPRTSAVLLDDISLDVCASSTSTLSMPTIFLPRVLSVGQP